MVGSYRLNKNNSRYHYHNSPSTRPYSIVIRSSGNMYGGKSPTNENVIRNRHESVCTRFNFVYTPHSTLNSAATAMSIAAVEPHFAFGIQRSAVPGSRDDMFHLIDDRTIVYVAGSNVVFYDTEKKSQRLLPISDKALRITAVTVSSDKRFLAVAEEYDTSSEVTVYDIQSFKKKRALCTSSECTSHSIVMLSFSADCRFLATLSGYPDKLLSYWSWNQGKVVANLNVPLSNVTQIMVNPFDPCTISVIGDKKFLFLHYGDDVLTPQTPEYVENTKYICHTWFRQGLLALGTEDGRVLVYEDTTLVQTITVHDAAPVTALTGFSRGFITGGNKNVVTVHETIGNMDEAVFEKTHVVLAPDDVGEVQTVALSQSEETIVCAMSEHCLYSIDTASPEYSSKPECPFKPLSFPFHSNTVTGMDVCIRKSLLATCSLDKTIRIWNFYSMTCELVRLFAEEITCIALHPSGAYIVAGFPDKLRLLNLLVDDLRLYKELGVRGCQVCRFANGGHKFAVSNGNTINIFNTWTFEIVGVLKGHNGRIKSLSWSSDDSRLVSSGTDGAVYCWSIDNLKRDNENILKSCIYNYAVVSNDNKYMYAVGSDKMFKEINDSLITREFPMATELTQLVFSHSGRMLFAGTMRGTVLALKFPVTEGFDVQEHKAHSKAVTCLRISHDDRFLFSGSEDGTFYCFRITDREERGLRKDRKVVYMDEVFVTRSDLEEKRSHFGELKSRIEELKLETEYQLRLKDMNFNEKNKELTDTYSQEMEELKIAIAFLKSEKERREVQNEDVLRIEKKKHQQELYDKESRHNHNMMLEFDKYQLLQRKVVDAQSSREKKVKDREIERQKLLSTTTSEYENKLRLKEAEYLKLQDELRQQSREFEETKRQIEEDIDAEIESIKAKYEKKYKFEKEEGLRLKGENGIMKKKFSTLQKDIEDYKMEREKMANEQRKIHDLIAKLEGQIVSHRKDVHMRDEIIQEKERKVFDLKKANQELEKYKFVLDYKIKDLREQIEPKEQAITNMSELAQSIGDGLQLASEEKQYRENSVTELKEEIRELKKVYLAEKQKEKNAAKVFKTFQRDLEACVQDLQVPAEELQKYCRSQEQMRDVADVDTGAVEESRRQTKELQRIHESLRKQSEKDKRAYRKDNMVKRLENMAMIKEIRVLQAEIKDIKVNDLAKILRPNTTGSQKSARKESLVAGSERPKSTDHNALPHITVPTATSTIET